jgi:aminoglycoside phosphotransferase (APT) family kinase protein
MEETLSWLKSHAPPCRELVLVDGDYRLGNMMVGEDGVHAVLDWELATIGDPVRDAAYTTLDYIGGKFLKQGSFPCNGVVDTEKFISAYEQRTGRSVEREAYRFWKVFGAFCLLTILYSGLRQFLEGNTRDIRAGAGNEGALRYQSGSYLSCPGPSGKPVRRGGQVFYALPC